MKKTILSARGLCKSFAHNGVQNHILSNLDLDVYEGDFTVIMGASGSGKSTLLYSLSGMDRATGGQVIYDGRDLVKMSEKELSALRCGDFGFVFQQMHLVSNLSLFENIAVPGYLNKNRTAAQTDSRTREMLEKMGISHISEHLPSQCSGGEQQRVAIARALAKNPKLLLCDEPTGALDYKTGKQVLALLQDTCRKTGRTVIVITHNTALTGMADRIIQVRSGRIVSNQVNEHPVPVEQIEW